MNDETEDSTPSPQGIDEAAAARLVRTVQRAAIGEEGADREFFELFLEAECFVATRDQPQELSDLAEYPQGILDVLALKASGDSESAVVPVFSSKDQIDDWCGLDLQTRVMRIDRLLSLLPEGWEVSFNPGAEFGKDFSAWEVEKLKQGKESIDEILEDLHADADPVTVKIENGELSEIPELEGKLREVNSEHIPLSAVYFLRQFRAEGGFIFLLGIETKEPTADEEIISVCDAAVQQLFVGREQCLVIPVSEESKNPLAKLFGLSEPVLSFE